jgi:hypothetical protein
MERQRGGSKTNQTQLDRRYNMLLARESDLDVLLQSTKWTHERTQNTHVNVRYCTQIVGC